MAEYIEREAVLKRLKFKVETDTTYNHLKQRGLESAMAQVRKAPAADVQPVVHARWMRLVESQYDSHTGEYWEEEYYNCSKCDYASDWASPYCPNFGAKMDAEGET